MIVGNIANLPSGLAMIFKMAFSVEAVGGGLCGSIVASMMNAMRYGVARGVFSNEAGMGSAAITAAAATTDNPVRQGYINMTGTSGIQLLYVPLPDLRLLPQAYLE